MTWNNVCVPALCWELVTITSESYYIIQSILGAVEIEL